MPKKRISGWKKRRKEIKIAIKFCIFKICDSEFCICAKFQVKLTILILWTKFAQKAYFRSKTKSEQHHWILHIWISLGTTFQLKTENFDFLDQICRKMVFPVEKRNSEHYQWILHIRIVVKNKFQLKLAVLLFGQNFPKKSISGRKQTCCVWGVSNNKKRMNQICPKSIFLV